MILGTYERYEKKYVEVISLVLVLLVNVLLYLSS